MWSDFVDGPYAGPNFDPYTYDIERFIEVQCPFSYVRGQPPKKSIEKARKLARSLYGLRG